MASWNEFNTFTKHVIPHLYSLGYPPREGDFFDEQTWVRKRDAKKGPYDGAYKDRRGVILLIEAKKYQLSLDSKHIQQALDYALGESFSVPPPFLLVSNGSDHLWYRRDKKKDEYSYSRCEAIPWRDALREMGSQIEVNEMGIKQLIKLLAKTRALIFDDLRDRFFPKDFSLAKSNLGQKLPAFERILDTRRVYVDPLLFKKESVAIQAVLSSVALSWVLKTLFIKLLSDLRAPQEFPVNLSHKIATESAKFPGILLAEPYDVLGFSEECEDKIVAWFSPIRITKAVIFEAQKNVLGKIWDGLVQTEEQDIQVKSLGNVYTPFSLVEAMVDSAENSFENWAEKSVLEPACGSGNFVRECYRRLLNTYLGQRGNIKKLISAHKKVLSFLKAIDIDPFAVQTTQLGMFLELYKKPDVWEALAPKGSFDFSSVVTCADYLASQLPETFKSFKPDLIIGNPPYGVSVTDKIREEFKLGSRDSYGCFISQSLKRISDEGRVVFITSSTFLTVKTHRELREQIFYEAQIESIHILHRNAFSGRDVFCCLIHLKKRRPKDSLVNYRFSDAWPIHPSKPEYGIALSLWSKKGKDKLRQELYEEYKVPQDLLQLRLMPPSPTKIEKQIASDAKIINFSSFEGREIVYPIFGGLPSLYLFSADQDYVGSVRKIETEFPKLGRCKAFEIKRDKRWVPVVKLWQLSRVLVGLQTSEDERFLGKTPGVIPNVRRQYIRDVNLRLCIKPEHLHCLSDEQKKNGIKVIDPQRDRYFIPFDKGGEQDTEKGELRAFWTPVDYWIDWSEGSVKLLKQRNKWKSGTAKKPRFQNSEYYFRQGIKFTPDGLYAPTFELSSGGVFGHTGDLILPFEEEITTFLLVILCSPLTRYFVKNFLEHGVHATVGTVKQIPIVVPTEESFNRLSEIGEKIIEKRRCGKNSDKELKQANTMVFDLYGVPKEDVREIKRCIFVLPRDPEGEYKKSFIKKILAREKENASYRFTTKEEFLKQLHERKAARKK